MTRYTKLERKRHVEASESFSVTPLMPAKSVSSKAAPSPAAQPSSAPDKPPKEKAKSKAKEAGHKSEGPQEPQADGENKKRKAEEGGEDKPSKKAKGGKGKKKEEAKPKTEQEAGVMALGKIDLVQGADDDDYHIFVEEKRKMTEETRVVKKLVKEGPKKVKKVVSF
ncbi:hypothetical protein DFQ27_007797 [Actinomortierella ambigua]|uniref:Uncharacterized protein n=1 Tax=Actinomortierella ambigua TaxID=1343610 RepID=A0A9P6PS36_9FUNG|nr:hypothetical protein DFQ27_007797 [Actinomortierella ambigua]